MRPAPIPWTLTPLRRERLSVRPQTAESDRRRLRSHSLRVFAYQLRSLGSTGHSTPAPIAVSIWSRCIRGLNPRAKVIAMSDVIQPPAAETGPPPNDRFTEGFATADLRAARQLLDELS
jgi:hypothetical protein